MVNVILRLAMLGSMALLSWNVLRYWLGALREPKKIAAPPEDRAALRAREMAGQATRRLTAMQVAVAELNDSEMWEAMRRFSGEVERLVAAMLADPGRHARAKRHLGQLLYAAEPAVKHFARHWRATKDPAVKAHFLEIAGELTAEFGRAADDYAGAGAADLKLEAEVLSDLMKRLRR